MRLDLPAEAIAGLIQVEGWRIARADIEREMLFLRREQPLTNRALRLMFREALVLADAYGGRLHSWMHAPGLTEWE